MSEENKILHISNLKQYFPVKKTKLFEKGKKFVRANDGIDLEIMRGETLGLVGESGCGKSTFGRVLLQLYKQEQGTTVYYGKSIYEYQPAYYLNELKGLEETFAKLAKINLENDPYGFGENLHATLTEHLGRMTGALQLTGEPSTYKELLISEYNAGCAVENAKKDGKDTSSLEAKHKEILNEIAARKKNVADHPKFNELEALWDHGIDLTLLGKEELRLMREDVQIIFQDPYASLNPRLTVGQIISEPLVSSGKFKKGSQELEDYIKEVMAKCGLDAYFINRYPHQFSGGQRQRIGIARALAVKPKFIVCDEAVSALDVSIQSQIINLLLDLKEEEDLTYLFISHDLSVIKYISDRVGVMYLGNMVELSDAACIFANPAHPYTKALLNAIPQTTGDRGAKLEIIEGDIPSPVNPPKGCKFHTRCKECMAICKEKAPEWKEIESNHFVACHLYNDEEKK